MTISIIAPKNRRSDCHENGRGGSQARSQLSDDGQGLPQEQPGGPKANHRSRHLHSKASSSPPEIGFGGGVKFVPNAAFSRCATAHILTLEK